MVIAPQTTPYQGDRIREGRSLFRVPGSSTHWIDLLLDQAISHQGHQREQPEKYWRGPRNRQVTPLSLSFYPEMRPRFFKGHFHPPTAHEPTQHLLRRMKEVGREQ